MRLILEGAGLARARLARLVLAGSVIALAACGSKEEKAPPAAGSGAQGSGSATAAPAPAPGSAANTQGPGAQGATAQGSGAQGSSAQGSAAAASSSGGGLPEACDEYRRTIERLAQCGDALPQATRDNLRAHFEKQWTGWEKLPEQDRRALADICKTSADSVKGAASAACGW